MPGGSAFADLVTRHYGAFCRCARSYVRDDAEAQDVVQLVLERIWRRGPVWESEEHLLRYCYKAVTNESLNRLKRRRTAPSQVREGGAAPCELEAPGGTAPDQELALCELQTALERALQGLPESRRLIFRLHRERGLTYREIAAELNISVKTVETQMARSLKFLHQELYDFL